MIVFFSIKGGIIINKNFEKVDAPIIGADGNVFNLIGICQRALKENGYQKEAKELGDRVTSSKSYDEALNIMMEYVNPTTKSGIPFEEMENYDDDYPNFDI